MILLLFVLIPAIVIVLPFLAIAIWLQYTASNITDDSMEKLDGDIETVQID